MSRKGIKNHKTQRLQEIIDGSGKPVNDVPDYLAHLHAFVISDSKFLNIEGQVPLDLRFAALKEVTQYYHAKKRSIEIKEPDKPTLTDSQQQEIQEIKKLLTTALERGGGAR